MIPLVAGQWCGSLCGPVYKHAASTRTYFYFTGLIELIGYHLKYLAKRSAQLQLTCVLLHTENDVVSSYRALLELAMEAARVRNISGRDPGPKVQFSTPRSSVRIQSMTFQVHENLHF